MPSKRRFLTLLILVALAPLAARADQKDDLMKKGDAAAMSGKPFDARDAYCQLADMDPNYPKAKMLCTTMKQEASREDDRCEKRFADANADVNAGKFDDAEQKLKNVKQGCKRYDEAKQLMAKLPGMRTAAGNETTAAQKFEEGQKAYNRNDFAAAKAALGAVPGGSSRSGDASALLNKIKQYEQAMAEADRLYNARTFDRAADIYVEAAKLKSDGPGDPNAKAAKARDENQKAIAAKGEEACRAQKPTFTGFQVTPNSGQAALNVKANVSANKGCKDLAGVQIQWGDGSQTDGNSGAHVYKNAGTYDVVAWVTDQAGNKVSTTQTVRVIEAAVKVQTPEVDVAKTLVEARAAKKKGDIAGARGKYMKVLSADKTNKEALDALDELTKMAAAHPEKPAAETPQATPGVISESDTLLAKGITEYYTGNFDDAYSDLRSYLQFKGEKMGLANFYLGALKATQYHLGGGTEQKALEAANNFFKAAKKSPKFKVPERYVSPKIVSMYNNAGM